MTYSMAQEVGLACLPELCALARICDAQTEVEVEEEGEEGLHDALPLSVEMPFVTAAENASAFKMQTRAYQRPTKASCYTRFRTYRV